MGMIKVHEFTTLDGVVDAPMWTMDYEFSDEFSDAIGQITGTCSGVLLGRTTYEMFAPAWSSRTVEDDPGAPFFNDSPKYVVSGTLEHADWNNSTVIGSYDADRIRELKAQQSGDLYVSGSATLVRALLADGLVDELHLLVYPVAVGTGIRLFPEGGPRTPMTLLGSRGFANGVAQLTYGPATA
ncbi:deaminase [Modestobacter sp. I12A-02628]|uniref:Dihydrofolate reductase family protein n=1 Tax=Goekera deserti TaxID=2497753 RepID=A0A7K3WDH6_9ACTN|nr:dihydrofolate reductase family protein [Goekera deserti]MPQ97144.1 deaminase [Goekera deserti]NDI46538.1 deaminase [Goekera deserti]NEL54528.1 dihydrofolate reductase family protein [Goekera deserti]